MASLYDDLNTDGNEGSRPDAGASEEYDPASTSGAGEDLPENGSGDTKEEPAQDDRNAKPSEGNESKDGSYEAPSASGDAAATTTNEGDDANKTEEDDSDKPVSVFVGGLAWSTTEAGLRMYFEIFGPVTHIDFKRGFAFVHFSNKKAADACIQAGTEHSIDGKMVEVKLSDPNNPTKQPNRSAVGGGYAPAGSSSTSASQPVISTSSPADQDAGRKVFVGGLPQEVREIELRQHMEQHGKVEEVVVMIDRMTQRSRGFGYVTYSTPDEAQAACKQRRQLIQNKMCEVKLYEPTARPVGGGASAARAPAGAPGYAHGQPTDWNRHRPFSGPAGSTGRTAANGGARDYSAGAYAPRQPYPATAGYHAPPYQSAYGAGGYYGGYSYGSAAPPYGTGYPPAPAGQQAAPAAGQQQQWGQQAYDYSAWSGYGAGATGYYQQQYQGQGGFPPQQSRGQDRR